MRAATASRGAARRPGQRLRSPLTRLKMALSMLAQAGPGEREPLQRDYEFIAPRLIGYVGQSFDHRVFDGAYSAAFLSRLKEILEERDWDAEFN